ncbi:unnamed protein product [Rotaria magnacalcarata]|uniref:DNA-(apurinic or apyrimidinic site) endonuclease n=1 Tax=Rotaria magnacalcarata TaxID=392030 RepID=A0A815DN34_9BILA|nr:unnamed protein product [Rotaria magnacalcarata]CAF1413676.1 unnamed protein product [Rotaria magnacalcarata]CAF2005624.1 unnamed protein product [Rotaria magnacalcarata]CAF2120953.1 unnamed protein product [Rotaria magnacalcarata]CAF3835804.1 unnamed protein product [Rotaria magnacalcarata]
MPKAANRKLSKNDTSKRDSKSNEDDEPIVTVASTTDERKSNKGVKRKASESTEKNVKKSTSVNEINTVEANQDVDDEEIQLPTAMTLKTSDRLSSNGNKPTVKFASWNINGIRAWLAKDGLKYIEQEQPDIMCFQELKCEKEKIPTNATPSGYKSYWLSGDTAGYSGVGLLTKLDPVDVKFGIGIAEHDNEGRIITAEYETFYFVVSYIPNSGRKLVRLEYRQEFNEAFRNYIKELDKKKPVVWCGDLNVSHQSIDLANPKSNTKIAGFTQEERDDFAKVLADGFIDSFRYLYPDERDAYTYWSYFRNARIRNIGWRLDYFIISSRLQEKLCDTIHQTGVYGSDHCPIVLLLSI